MPIQNRVKMTIFQLGYYYCYLWYQTFQITNKIETKNFSYKEISENLSLQLLSATAGPIKHSLFYNVQCNYYVIVMLVVPVNK